MTTLRAVQRGFTLVEILVVTVIIGIGLALVVANLQPDDSQAVRRDATLLAGQLEQLQERALFGGRAIGVTLSAEGLSTWQRDAKGEWAAAPVKTSGRPQPLALESFKLGAQTVETDARLVFLPDGVNQPFELVVGRDGHRFRITGDALGRIQVAGADA
jgi:general secretion pathway protein H